MITYVYKNHQSAKHLFYYLFAQSWWKCMQLCGGISKNDRTFLTFMFICDVLKLKYFGFKSFDFLKLHDQIKSCLEYQKNGQK